MRTKLSDIQNNKSFLEKKIFEYEKKLKELKGNKKSVESHSRCESMISSLHNVKAMSQEELN